MAKKTDLDILMDSHVFNIPPSRDTKKWLLECYLFVCMRLSIPSKLLAGFYPHLKVRCIRQTSFTEGFLTEVQIVSFGKQQSPRQVRPSENVGQLLTCECARSSFMMKLSYISRANFLLSSTHSSFSYCLICNKSIPSMSRYQHLICSIDSNLRGL